MNRLISLTFLLALIGCLDVPPKGQAQTANRAALVIQFDSAQVLTFCISFSEPSISGHDLLQRSGLPVISAIDPLGYAVCKIDQLGCPEEDCFCQSPPNYWSYWHLNQGGWVYSAAGSSTYLIQNGAVDAWVWGPGPGYPPPLVTFDQICNPTPTPSNTPTSTSTATQTPTPTASHTATVTTPPTSTLSPTITSPHTTATSKSAKTPRQPAFLLQSTPTAAALQGSPVPTASIPLPTRATSTFPPTVVSQPNPQFQVAATSTLTQPFVPAQAAQKLKRKGSKSSQVEANEIRIPAKATQPFSQSSKQSFTIKPTSSPVANSHSIQKLGAILRYSIFGLLVLGLSVGLGVIVYISRR